jgi:hypothetical protein
MILMLVLSLPVWAATIAHWDMADSGAVNGAYMPGNSSREADIVPPATKGPEDFLISSRDLSGNGNHLSAWTSAWMKWTNDSFRGDFGMIASGNYPDSRTDSTWNTPVGVDVQTITPTQWTVECVFKATAGTNRTMVGRTGYQVRTGTPATAPFYLAERSGAAINCEFVDVTGAYYDAHSAGGTLVAGTWYHVAAVSNGTTLTLYLKNLTAGTDYAVVATAALGTNPAIALGTGNAFGTGVWTVACGTYNNGTTDRFVSPGIIDEVAISDTALAPGKFVCMLNRAYSPNPLPLNVDKTVGTLNLSNTVDLTLNFKAGKDPNTVRNYPVNPAILKHYIYVGTNSTSLPLVASVNQVINPNPALTDPANTYATTLNQNVVYYWKVEEGVNNGSGVACPAGDPNNIPGAVWSFKTIAATPVIMTQPRPTVADASGNASFSVTGSATVTSYQWFKEAGTTDTQLTNAGIYSGVTTSTLTITGATLSAEGQYYCIAYNGTTPSTPSSSVWLLTKRLVGYWKFDGNMDDSVQSEVAGATVHNGAMNTGDPNYLNEPNSLSGTAMSFFNDGSYVTIPDTDFFNFFRKGFTFSCWYRDLGTDGWRLIFSKLDVGSAGWLFGKNDTGSNVNFVIEIPNTTLNSGTTVNVSNGLWHMLTSTYDAATNSMKVFVDGDQRAAVTIDLSNVALPVTPVSIGGLGTDAIKGGVDEVRMYDYPLTPTQIAAMYLGFKPGGFICAELDGGISAYDLNKDCRINMADFALIATQWLECNRIPTGSCSW